MDNLRLVSKQKLIQRLFLGDITLDKNRLDYMREYQLIIGLNRFNMGQRLFHYTNINGLNIIYEKEDIGESECFFAKDAGGFHHHIEHRVLGIAQNIGVEKDKKLYAYFIKQAIEDYIKELITTGLIEKNKGLCPYAISFKSGL